jgi:hypothetical protein
MLIHRLAIVSDAQIEALADVLLDCVEGGASVSFMLPLSRAKALAFWRGAAEAVARGERALMVAEDGRGLVGTVQLVLEQPEAAERGAGMRQVAAGAGHRQRRCRAPVRPVRLAALRHDPGLCAAAARRAVCHHVFLSCAGQLSVQTQVRKQPDAPSVKT